MRMVSNFLTNATNSYKSNYSEHIAYLKKIVAITLQFASLVCGSSKNRSAKIFSNFFK